MTAPLAPQVDVKFKASGVEQVQRGLKLVGSTGEGTARQVGGAMRQIAGGVEQVARQGKVSGEALKGILTQGAEIAFLFGAGGAVVGALAVTGLAIYEHVTGRMKEAREEINKTRTELENLARGDLVGAGRRQQMLFSGDRNAIRKEGESDAEFLARARGIEGLNARIGVLGNQLPAGIRARAMADAQAYALGGVPWSVRPGGIQAELIDLYKELSKLNPQFQLLTGITADLAKSEGERAKNAQQIAQEEYLKNLPLSPEQIAQHGAMDALLDPILKRKLPGVQSMAIGGTLMTSKLGGEDGARTFNLRAADIAKKFDLEFVSPLAEQIARSIQDGIGGALSAGFDAAFAKGGNIGKAASAFGASALATIGGVFKQIGVQSLIGLQFMNAIKVAITSWNPALGIAASIGLIALGSALQSAGSRMAENSMGGASSGSSVTSAPAQIIDRGSINPAATVGAGANATVRQPVNNYFTVIGPNDPQAQRTFRELQRASQQRGV